MKLNLFRHLLLAAVPVAVPAAAVSDGQLTLTIVANGLSYRAQQPLRPPFGNFSSGVMATAQGVATREYMTMHCDATWGALKSRQLLPIGPGYSLQASGDGGLLLRILEHTVISRDAAINAMAMHCTDLQPRPVVRSIATIKLDPAKGASQQLALANGYSLSYRYVPATTGE